MPQAKPELKVEQWFEQKQVEEVRVLQITADVLQGLKINNPGKHVRLRVEINELFVYVNELKVFIAERHFDGDTWDIQIDMKIASEFFKAAPMLKY